MYLRTQSASTSTSEELEKMNEILSSLPEYEKLLDMVLNDLNSFHSSPDENCKKEGDDFPCAGVGGRKGMSAEQVLKSFIVKNYKNQPGAILQTARKNREPR